LLPVGHFYEPNKANRNKIHHIWSMETPNEQLGQGTATVFNGLIKMWQDSIYNG